MPSSPPEPSVPPPTPAAERLSVGTDVDLVRLRVLAAHRLSDPGLRYRLDDLCRRTAAALGRETVLVTVLVDEAEMLLGGHGVSGCFADHGGVPSEWSLCLHAPPRCAPYEIVDTWDEAAFERNPLVVVEGIRSYAAVPLITVDAVAVGVVAALDRRPGALDRRGLAVLVEAAHEASWALAAVRDDA